ncbi:FG-GAP repeat domain-containing protein [Streptomyces sp. NPDC002817]|uniref:FG-GAP repeat domain-containing protein n=1 Tax=Streptomyces sp. NPDC088357 TaxID=3154655 RepID=UPI0034264212
MAVLSPRAASASPGLTRALEVAGAAVGTGDPVMFAHAVRAMAESDAARGSGARDPQRPGRRVGGHPRLGHRPHGRGGRRADGPVRSPAEESGGGLSLLLGDGTGSFTADLEAVTVTRPHGLALTDFDGDGDLDMATASAATAGGVSVALGNGDGTFGDVTQYASVARLHSITSGDFDGDGGTDLATVSNGSNTLEIFTGNGDGTFDDSVAHTTSALPVSVNAADLDGDDVTDVLVSSLNGDSVTVFQGTPGGALAELAELTADGALPTRPRPPT